MTHIIRKQLVGKNEIFWTTRIGTPEQSVEISDSNNVERLVLSGGEPTLRTDLPKLLATLRKNGTNWLSMRTDGILFSKAGMATNLMAMGLRSRVYCVPDCPFRCERVVTWKRAVE